MTLKKLAGWVGAVMVVWGGFAAMATVAWGLLDPLLKPVTHGVFVQITAEVQENTKGRILALWHEMNEFRGMLLGQGKDFEPAKMKLFCDLTFELGYQVVVEKCGDPPPPPPPSPPRR